MDFDLYFTIREQDLQDEDETYCEREEMEITARGPCLQAGHLSSCIEDSLTEYISDLRPGPPQNHKGEQLMKPLPPIPEEPKAIPRSLSDAEHTTPRFDSETRSSSEPSQFLRATDESDKPSLQRRSRVTRSRSLNTINQRISSPLSASTGRPCPTQASKNISLWPNPHVSDTRKDSQASIITPQRHIDSPSDPDFDSLHSQESCDLDRWASDIYGPQDSTMTSLRDKRRAMVPSAASTTKYTVEPLPIVRKGPISKPHQDSAYCSSISASSCTDRDRNSSNTMSELLAEYTEQWRLQDTETTSFFDSGDDEKLSNRTLEKRPPIKKLWRKVAISLQTAKGRFPRPQTKTSGMAPVDVPMILT